MQERLDALRIRGSVSRLVKSDGKTATHLVIQAAPFKDELLASPIDRENIRQRFDGTMREKLVREVERLRRRCRVLLRTKSSIHGQRSKGDQ